MAAKVFVLLLVALFAFQGCVDARNPMSRQERAVSDIIDMIIEKIKEIFQGLVDQAHEIWLSIIEKFQDLWAEAVEFVQNIVKNIKDEIQKLIEQAEEVQVDVQECVLESEKDIGAFIAHTEAKLHVCIDPAYEMLEEVNSHALSEYDRVKMEIDTLEKRFSGCSEITCYLGVVYDALALMDSIPGRIGVVVEQFTNLAQTVANTVPPCIKEGAPSVIEEASNIQKKVTDCIVSKIEGAQ